MNNCPPEVLYQISELLDFSDVASFRMVSRKLADIGAEHLVTQVRFHCSKTSLNRLKAMSEHQFFKQHITSVVFEGNILAQIPCQHIYSAHYDLEHHKAEKPQPPPEHSTKREKRLYERNVAKFNTELVKKYKDYHAAFEVQQSLIHSESYLRLISTCIASFPKLDHVTLSTVGRCSHVLSERFLDEFALDCAMPMEQDTSHTQKQLEVMLFPSGAPLQNLKCLDVHVLSPRFFSIYGLKPKSAEVFKSLERVSLTFRLQRDERDNIEAGVDLCYGDFKKGGLHNALATATNLKQLTIKFDDFNYYGSCTNIANILKETSWPKLNSLDVDCMCADDKYLIAALKHQPALRHLKLGFFTLTKGLWSDMVMSMQKELSLDQFRSTGILDDPGNMYEMDHVDVDAYTNDFVEFTATEVLDMFVCHDLAPGERDDPEPYNPLTDLTFDDPERLREEFGSPFYSDLDETSDMECD